MIVLGTDYTNPASGKTLRALLYLMPADDDVSLDANEKATTRWLQSQYGSGQLSNKHMNQAHLRGTRAMHGDDAPITGLRQREERTVPWTLNSPRLPTLLPILLKL